MKSLLNGIVDFRRKLTPEARERFAQLALGQSPDALFIACSDSRVVPNLFASTNPGDLFVVRNVGNIIPPCSSEGVSLGDRSEASAIEFAVTKLEVQDIIICGHSECGAMQAIAAGKEIPAMPNLGEWLKFGASNSRHLGRPFSAPANLAPHNLLSQRNALLQVEHVLTYPAVRRRIEEGKLKLHAWWFDIASAEVLAFDPQAGRYVLIDEGFLKRQKAESAIGKDLTF